MKPRRYRIRVFRTLIISSGFSDSNYFARQFRKVMGMPASEFRRR